MTTTAPLNALVGEVQVLLFAGGQPSTLNTSNASLAIQQLAALPYADRKKLIPTLKLGIGDYFLTSADFLAIRGLRIIGQGKYLTRLFCRATKPAVIQRPSMAGSPSKRNITTDCLGIYLGREGEIEPDLFEIDNLEMGGLLSTPSAAGQYSLIRAAAHNVKIGDGFASTNELSDTVSAFSAYKSLNARTATILRTIAVGEDYWTQPNPNIAMPCSKVWVSPLSNWVGEPLVELGETTASVVHFTARKAVMLSLGGRFNDHIAPNIVRNASDLRASNNIAADDQIKINAWNPYKERVETLTFTWKASPSGDFEAATGADKYISMRNMADKVIRQSITQRSATGTYAFELLRPQDYIPGTTDLTVSAFRVRSTYIDSNGLRVTSGVPGSKASNALITESVDGGGVLTVVNVNDGSQRGSYGIRAFDLRDCFEVIVDDVHRGVNTWTYSFFSIQATLASLDFNYFLGAETGHTTIGNVRGHTDAYGDCDINFETGGFINVTNGYNPGQCGLGASTVHTPCAEFGRGIHRATTVTLTSGNVSNGDHADVTDGNGNTRVFTWRASPDATNPLDMAIGSDNLESLRNLRYAIQRELDLHLLQAYTVEPVAAGGGSYALTITYFTLTKYTGASDTTVTGASLSKASATSAAIPADITFKGNPHYVASLVDGYSLPIARFTQCASAVNVDSHIANLAPTNPANAAQAIRSFFIVTATLPANNSTFAVDSLGATARTITFKTSGGHSVADPAYIIDVSQSDANTANLLAQKIASVVNANENHFKAGACYVADYPTAGFAEIRILDGTPGANASLVTLGGTHHLTELGDVGFNLQGNASVEEQGQSMPFIFVDCALVNLKADMHPLAFAFVSGADYSETWNNIPRLENAYAGFPMHLAYFKKTNVNLETKVTIDSPTLFGPFGIGRFGKSKLYDKNSNMADADITILDATIQQSGAAGTIHLTSQRSAFSKITVVSVPTDNSQITIDSLAAAPRNFIFHLAAGLPADADPNYYINTTTATTATLCAQRLQQLIEAISDTLQVEAVAAGVGGVTVTVRDLTPGSNTTLIAKSGGDSAGSLTFTTPTDN